MCTVPPVDDGVIDLRRPSLLLPLLAPVVLGPFAVAMLLAVFDADDAVLTRVVAGVLGSGLLTLALLGALKAWDLRRPLRLVIDHEGIRLERGLPKPVFRLAWTEIAGASVLVDRNRSATSARPSTAYSMALDLVPTDLEAVRRHPELRLAWRMGGEWRWRIGLSTLVGTPPPIGELVARHRPELWRGERSGSILARPTAADG